MPKYLFLEWVENQINVTSHAASIHRYETWLFFPFFFFPDRSQTCIFEGPLRTVSFLLSNQLRAFIVPGGEGRHFDTAAAAAAANSADVEETLNPRALSS